MLSEFLHPDPDRNWTTSATLRDLVVESERVASHLGPATAGGRIVVSCRDARYFLPGLFGSWLSGSTVELLPNVQDSTLDRVDADRGITAILHDDASRSGRSTKARYVPAVLAGPTLGPLPRAEWPEVALLMTTSGTTGTPASVAKTAPQLLSELSVLAKVIQHPTCVLSTVPASHLYGLLWGTLLPLRMGARIACHSALLPADIRAAVEREHVDLLVSTPAHLRAMVVAAMPRGLRVISSGARLPGSLHMSLSFAHAWQITDVMGSTETGGIALRTSPISGWAPLPEVVVSANGRRMVVSSPWCAQVELDDEVELDPDGRFRYVGRNHEVIKVGGKRAHALAMEAAVLEVPGIEDVAVVVHMAEGREPRIAMAIAMAPGGAGIPRDAVAAAIRQQFDAVFVPKIVKQVANIPRTDRGKIDRDALSSLFIESGSPVRHIAAQRVAHGQYTAQVPHDLIFFQGHFEAMAILPGAVLVERLVWPIVRTEWPDIGCLRGIRRLRFRRPVFPGQQLSVKASRNADRIVVEVTCASSAVASAQLLVE